jgi:hypothetical protein
MTASPQRADGWRASRRMTLANLGSLFTDPRIDRDVE